MESKMKYTKGPWIINYHRGAQNCFRLDNEQSASEFIAEHEGNKALITAAPELLEALKYLIEQSDGVEDGKYINMSRKAWIQAEAAVAKAEGKAK